MSYVYDDYGNLKNNCLIVIPLSEPINIRGLRSDANWTVRAIHNDINNKIDIEVDCVFWTKKEALQFLRNGFHKCNITNEIKYKIKQ